MRAQQKAAAIAKATQKLKNEEGIPPEDVDISVPAPTSGSSGSLAIAEPLASAFKKALDELVTQSKLECVTDCYTFTFVEAGFPIDDDPDPTWFHKCSWLITFPRKEGKVNDSGTAIVRLTRKKFDSPIMMNCDAVRIWAVGSDGDVQTLFTIFQLHALTAWDLDTFRTARSFHAPNITSLQFVRKQDPSKACDFSDLELLTLGLAKNEARYRSEGLQYVPYNDLIALQEPDRKTAKEFFSRLIRELLIKGDKSDSLGLAREKTSVTDTSPIMDSIMDAMAYEQIAIDFTNDESSCSASISLIGPPSAINVLCVGPRSPFGTTLVHYLT